MNIITKYKDIGSQFVIYKKYCSNKIRYKRESEYTWFKEIEPETGNFKFVYYSDESDTYKLSSVYKPELDNFIIGVSWSYSDNFYVYTHGWVGPNAKRLNEYYCPFFSPETYTAKQRTTITNFIDDKTEHKYIELDHNNLYKYDWETAVNYTKYFWGTCYEKVNNFGINYGPEYISHTAEDFEGFQIAYYYKRLDDNNKYGHWFFPDIYFHSAWNNRNVFYSIVEPLRKIGVSVGEYDDNGGLSSAFYNTSGYENYIRFSTRYSTMVVSRAAYENSRSGIILMKTLDKSKIIGL